MIKFKLLVLISTILMVRSLSADSNITTILQTEDTVVNYEKELKVLTGMKDSEIFDMQSKREASAYALLKSMGDFSEYSRKSLSALLIATGVLFYFAAQDKDVGLAVGGTFAGVGGLFYILPNVYELERDEVLQGRTSSTEAIKIISERSKNSRYIGGSVIVGVGAILGASYYESGEKEAAMIFGVLYSGLGAIVMLNESFMERYYNILKPIGASNVSLVPTVKKSILANRDTYNTYGAALNFKF